MPPSLKGGICSKPGCTEPRQQYSSGKYSLHCLEHTREKQRVYARKRRDEGMVIATILPAHVRILARRCLSCGEKLPNTFEYFNHWRDKPPRWYWICRTCDGTAEYFAISPGQTQTPAPDAKLYPCPPCNGTGGIFKAVKKHMERVLCKVCGGTGEVDGETHNRFREELASKRG